MFNLYSNDKLNKYVRSNYTATAAKTGHYGFVLDSLEDYSKPFGEQMLERLSNTVGKANTLAHCVANLHGIATLVGEKFGQEYENEFRLVAEKASELEVEQSQERAGYLPKKDIKSFLATIDSPVGRAVLGLARTAGLTPNDLLRELNGLEHLKDGLAVIGERYHASNTAPRTVHFDPALLNELDPEGEVIDVVKRIVGTVTPDNVGLKGLVLGTYYQGSGLTVADMRNSHAYDLLNEGYLYQDVAEIQGIATASLKDRVRKFTKKAGLR